MFKKTYNVYVTLNNNEEGYGLEEVLKTMDYYGIEHDFHSESVSFHEFLEGVEKYRIEVKASKKQIKKVEEALNAWTEVKVA